MGYVYYTDQPDSALPASTDLGIKMASSVGTVLGQIGFGVLNDMYGRKKVPLRLLKLLMQMYGTELIIMIVATLGLTLGTTGGSVSVVWVTIFWRFILGIGIGGDYPNSSVLVSEFSNVRWRGAMMAAMFSAQGFGAFFAALTGLLCVTGFRNSLNSNVCDSNCQLALDKSWRIVYGMGIVPAVIALYFRLTIPESPRWDGDVARNTSQAARNAVGFTGGAYVEDADTLLETYSGVKGGYEAPPKASFRDFRRYFGLWKNGKVLLGTAGSWFLLDISFVPSPSSYLLMQYGIGLNTSPLLEIIGFSPSGNNTILQKYDTRKFSNSVCEIWELVILFSL